MSTETTSSADISIPTKGISLTDVAAEKVSALLIQEGRDDLSLRVAVQPGGCSGLRYQLYFDDRKLDGDSVVEFAAGKVKVVTDKMSTPYLMGATIDFVDTIQKQGFTIDNPNAQGSCAFGLSIINTISSQIEDVVIASAPNGISKYLSISIKSIEADRLLLDLEDKGFSVDSGSACKSADMQPSHVLAAMGRPIVTGKQIGRAHV